MVLQHPGPSVRESVRDRLVKEQHRCNRNFTEKELDELVEALVMSEHPRSTAERLLFKFGMYDRNGMPPVKTEVVALAVDLSA